MKTKKSIALLLCLLLTLTLFVPSSTAFAAKGDSGSDNGMVVSKTATANTDGTYTIKLEAYATGSKVISEVKKDIPTDIVLVLDQSGSMEDPIGTVSFEEYKDETGWWGNIEKYHTRNQDYYEYRHNGGNGNLWYYDENSKTYYSVSVTVKTEYTKIENGRNNSTNGGATNYWNNRNNLYAKVNGEYQKVTVTRKDGTYTYTLPDGTVIGSARGYTGEPDFKTTTDDGYLYLASADSSQYVYTYTYTDANGVTQTIGSSTGATTVPNFTLYERIINENAGGSRLNALKTAVTTFANSVAEKAEGADGVLGTEDDINHRIAVVGFASGNPSSTLYLNSEVFVGANQYQYNTTASQHYAEAFQNMNEVAGKNNVAASIKALDANGATYTNLGVEMANGILEANPIENGTKRNRVVVVFTDGIPGRTGWSTAVANSAISQSNTAKQTYGATVYTVGIFSGADATSAGDSDGDETQKANWFMQNLSSNNGTPKTPSYYLSAADASTLNNIFKQISEQIESGGSSTTLTKDAVVKDIIAPQFTLPAGADANDITLETYECTGKNGDDYTWSKNATAMGAHAEINDITDENGVVSKTVSVTGFDFAGNYVGPITENGTVTGYKGHKLVISFTVRPKTGFLGGNNVYTNTSAGIYENSTATTPVVTFERPQVNVPIKQITVTAQDQNVYLLADVSVKDLKDATTVTVGTVPLNLTETNYGLEPWQYEYVNILSKVTYSNAPEADATDLTGLTDDKVYIVSVTVSPQKDPEASSKGDPAELKSGSGRANINVFKPVLTFKDSAEDYLSTHAFPGYYELTGDGKNHVSDVWKHGETVANVTEMGTAPTLELTYTPESGSISNAGQIIADHDIPVNVVVNIGETSVTDYVTFNHQSCLEGSGCEWSYGASHMGNETSKPEFLIHVKNVVADLTIRKTGLNTNVYPDGDNESAIVTIACTDPDKDSRTWTVVLTKKDNWRATLSGLKVGATYSVTEQTGWTWRYTSTNLTNTVTIVKEGSSVTIENTQTNPYWLGGDNYCVNEFAPGQATTD